jgi:hypothetical protein
MDNFKAGEIRQLEWDFNAEVFAAPGYRKITFKVYNMPESANGQLLLENVAGSATTYVLCPGGNGLLPQITFTGSSPQILYYEGTRHFYLNGTGFDMLMNTDAYRVVAIPREGTADSKNDPNYRESYVIPGDNLIFTVDNDGNTIIDVVIDEPMALGDYDLIFMWEQNQNPGGIPEELKAPALAFKISDDPSYRNDYYGILAIVKEEPASGKWEYHIETFPGEVQFKAFKNAEDFEGEVLVEIRGEFKVERDLQGNIVSAAAASLDEDSDPININGVIDISEGDVAVVLNEGTVKSVIVDMEGKILTSYSRTPVWTGVAYLTPFEWGIDCGLVAYDRRGNKLGDEQEAEYLFDREIRICWNPTYKILQTIAGMVVHMKYGTLGKMYDRDLSDPNPGDSTAPELGYEMSFGAALDISKLMPKGRQEEPQSEMLPIEVAHESKFGDERKAERYLKDYNKSKKEADEENKANKTKPVGKVNIEDILYGLNQGLMGVNA